MNNKKNRVSIIFISLGIIILFAVILLGNKHLGEKQEILLSESALPVIKEEQEVYSQDNIFVYSLNGNVDIYIKGSEKESNKYIGFHLHRFRSELNREVGASNYDVYKIEGADEYRRVLNDRFFFENNVVRKGEWEMAIKEQGANDFIGGNSHGDEVMKSVEMYVEGKEVKPNKFIKQEADEFKLVTTSDIYRDNTMVEDLQVIGTHEKVYTFNKDGLNLEQKVIFNQELILDKSYLTMLPIFRKDDLGRQVTDATSIPDKQIEQNVSEEGFQRVEVEANKATISGEESGITATVEILEKGINEPTLVFVTQSPLYNKIYFSYVQNGYQVEKGEVWRQTAHYSIDTKN